MLTDVATHDADVCSHVVFLLFVLKDQWLSHDKSCDQSRRWRLGNGKGLKYQQETH